MSLPLPRGELSPSRGVPFSRLTTLQPFQQVELRRLTALLTARRCNSWGPVHTASTHRQVLQVVVLPQPGACPLKVLLLQLDGVRIALQQLPLEVGQHLCSLMAAEHGGVGLLQHLLQRPAAVAGGAHIIRGHRWDWLLLVRALLVVLLGLKVAWLLLVLHGVRAGHAVLGRAEGVAAAEVQGCKSVGELHSWLLEQGVPAAKACKRMGQQEQGMVNAEW